MVQEEVKRKINKKKVLKTLSEKRWKKLGFNIKK